jgi:nitrate/nitrite transporter NarK
VIWLALALASVGAAEAPTWTTAVEVGGPDGGTATAIVNTGGNLGGFIAPFLTPLVSHAVRDSFGLFLYTKSQRVWRRNTRGDYWVIDLGTRKAMETRRRRRPVVADVRHAVAGR